MTDITSLCKNYAARAASQIRLAQVISLLMTLVVVACTLQPDATDQIPNTLAPIPLDTATLNPTDLPVPASITAPAPASGAVPATLPPPPRPPLIAPEQPINLPPGFAIGVFAQGLNGPRMLAIGPDGQLYVADRDANRIVRLPDLNGDGIADGIQVVADDLDRPSSLAFYKDGSLYVGETTRILRLSKPDAAGVFQERQVIIDGLALRRSQHPHGAVQPGLADTVRLDRLFLQRLHRGRPAPGSHHALQPGWQRRGSVRPRPAQRSRDHLPPGHRRVVGYQQRSRQYWATTCRRRRSTWWDRGMTSAGRAATPGISSTRS